MSRLLDNVPFLKPVGSYRHIIDGRTRGAIQTTGLFYFVIRLIEIPDLGLESELP